MSWCSAQKTLGETAMRKAIIDKVYLKKAFWLLPEEGQDCWVYKNNQSEKYVILRNCNEPQCEIILSDCDDLNKKAFKELLSFWSLLRLKAGELSFWTTKLLSFLEEDFSTSTLGVYEGTARERLNSKKNFSQLNAVLIRSENDLEARRRPHKGFPKPMQGFFYKIYLR